MNFVSVRIITADPRRLAAFYQTVTGVTAAWYSESFAELQAGCTLAIAGEQTLALFGQDIAAPAANRSLIVEFRVADVDADWARLRGTVGPAVQEPTTMPWGNRSLLFRDPDGNLVNLFTPVSAEARRKFGG